MMEGVDNQKKRHHRRSLEQQSLYERNNDSLMIFFWLLLVVIQWNCLGETLDIIEQSQQDSSRLKIGIIGELIVNLVFALDFFFFKKENYKSLELHSNMYLGVDFLAGPVALIGDIISLVFSGRLNIYSSVFRSCKALSTVQARRVFSKVGQILPRVKDMFLCLFCVFYMFTYIATYLYGDLFKSKYYFNSIGFSFFTMLQIMTLDGWGEIGRDILRRQNMFSASFLIVFVFIMGYFFWNILIGFILEILRSFESTSQENEKQHQQISNQSLDNRVRGISQNESKIKEETARGIDQELQSQSAKDLSLTTNHKADLLDFKKTQDNMLQTSSNNAEITIKEDILYQDDSDQEKIERVIQSENESFYEIFCFGYLYKRIVIGLYFLVLLNSLFNEDLQNIDGPFSEILHVTTSFIYTLHTILIYTQDTYRFQIERKHTWMMAFHILSGPTALLFDIASLSTQGTIGVGGILKLLKVFTATRETIMGAIMIFPTLLPAFLGIISIIFLLALWALNYLKNVENFWVDFNTSVYTFVQILTLDDWAAKLIKDLLKQDKYFTPVVFVGFIFVANYFFLNMMIAFSCETFKKVTNEDYVYRKQRKQADFYEQEDNSIQGGVYHSLQELYQDLDVVKDSHLNKQAFALIKDAGPEKELTHSEKHLYQLLLEAKYGQISLNSPIQFTLNGKTITMRQRDLSHLKFHLCEPVIEEGEIHSSQQV